jgi:hypothetical protein
VSDYRDELLFPVRFKGEIISSRPIMFADRRHQHQGNVDVAIRSGIALYATSEEPEFFDRLVPLRPLRELKQRAGWEIELLVLLSHVPQRRRAVQANPSLSVTQSWLVAVLVKLGRTGEAKAIAKQVLALQPSFSSSRFCAAVGTLPAVGEALMEAWHEADLPP